MSTSRSRAAAAVIVAAVTLCGAVAACGSAEGTDGDPGKVIQLSCPGKFTGTAPWVPSRPHGINGKARMVPQQAPNRAVICAYSLSPADPGDSQSSLKGSRQLAGPLSTLAMDLTWLPRQLAGTSYACAGMGIGQRTHYLLGLTYPNGTEWVSSTDDEGSCTTTSNGRFTSQVNIGAQVTASYRAAAWAPIPPPPFNTSHDPCTEWRTGRLGQEQHLVPGQPTSIRLCSGTARSETAYRSATLSHGFQPLLDALNALPTKPTQSACQGDGSQATYYELLASYDQGPNVFVRIDPHCAPAIDNRTLQAPDATSITPLLEGLLPR